MKTLKAVCALTILSVAGYAQDSTITNGRPDLEGLWEVHNPASPQTVVARFDICQSGNGLKMLFADTEKPAKLVYEGAFESNTSIAGKALDTNAAVERWEPMKVTVINANTLRLESGGLILMRATPRQVAYFRQLQRLSLSHISVRPFDLRGTWSFDNGLQAAIAEETGEITLTEIKPAAKPFFRGRYTSNPDITGEGIGSDGKGGAGVGHRRITVEDPDHILYEGKPVHRVSKPAAHDVPCDENNTNHVSDYYAWLRGTMALQEKDYRTAKCWLAVGADWQYPPAESLLAAVIVDGKDGTAPDYARAFNLLTKSASQGDVAAQFQLAGMYREGKGTPADPEKADLLLRSAKDMQFIQEAQKMMTPEAMLDRIEQVMGMVGSMVDFNLSMTPQSCFSHDVLGNRASSACPY